MDLKTHRHAAAARLASREDPRRLSAAYAAITLGLSLLVTAVNFILARQLDSATGLAGIGTRSLLTTAQWVLSLSLTVLAPFLEMGFLSVCLGLARDQRPGFPNLWDGLRRFGPVLRLNLIRMLLLLLLGVLCAQAAGFLFMLSPFSLPAMEALSQMTELTDPAAMEAAMETVLPLMVPMYLIFGAVLLTALFPVVYRLRLADFLIMDKTPRALQAMQESNRAMRGHMWQYCKLDLGFWWYYLGQLLATALAYGDTLLTALKVPVNADVAYFAFFLLSLAAQFLLTWRFAPLVTVTHALAYDALTADNEQIIIHYES